ncbi:MAG TPA: type II secretion system F family protein [Candidatus Nanoarchaeia archaeon]|nr:type II secretion system F family protein [Candidatus Nanoarchaeia archaeon]
MIFSKPESKSILRKKLLSAGINKKPEVFLSQTLRSAIFVGVCMAVLAFFFTRGKGSSIMIAILVGFIFFAIAYFTLSKSIDAKISKRAKKIDKDVLFAGRFLLIKLNSGKPLINSLVDASQSYGVASSYFKEIIRDIDLGTPLEDALEKATDDCPSKKMRRVLFQINNALRIGIDVTQNLEAVLEEIANEQLVEIQRYGKKLNSLTLFYMLIAVVMPSLGLTMFIVVAGLVSLDVGPSTFFVFAFFIMLIEFMFLSLFKSIRPNVNI